MSLLGEIQFQLSNPSALRQRRLKSCVLRNLLNPERGALESGLQKKLLELRGLAPTVVMSLRSRVSGVG